MVELRRFETDGLVEITPRRFGDERGFFSETWNRATFAEAGFDLDFVQDNHSYSADAGVLRGLHFQKPPVAQDKLVRVTRGAAFDVAVDLRSSSPTFRRWIGVELSAEKWNQLLVPKGFAHGFVTLVDHTEVLYKVTAPYSPEHECSVRFDDPDLAIEWPGKLAPFQLSAKDQTAPRLRDIETGY